MWNGYNGCKLDYICKHIYLLSVKNCMLAVNCQILRWTLGNVPAHVLSYSHFLCLYSTVCSARNVLLCDRPCSGRLRAQAVNLCFKSCRKFCKLTLGVWILLVLNSRNLCTYAYSYNLFSMLLHFHYITHRDLYF